MGAQALQSRDRRAPAAGNTPAGVCVRGFGSGSLRRARARTPKAVLATLGQQGVGVPAQYGPRGVGRAAGTRPGPQARRVRGVSLERALGDRSRGCANLRVRMTGRQHVGPRGELLEDLGDVEATTDACDRAHRVYGHGVEAELLASARGVPMARPRQYHRMYMSGPRGARVSFETVAERTAERAARLGLGPGPAMHQVVAASLGRLGAMSPDAERTVLRGQPVRERYGEGRGEQRERSAAERHERQVAAILAAHGARGVRSC